VDSVKRTSTNGKIDHWILLAVVVLVLIGLLSVSSASAVISYERFGNNFEYLKKQLIVTIMGLVAMGITAMIDYRYWRKIAYPLMILTIVLLLAVFLPGIGREIGGARAWIFIGPINFQPAELVKLTFLLYLAAWLERQGEGIRNFQSGFAPFAIIMGIVAGLVMMQPDLGTLTIIVAISAAMFFAAGASFSQIGVSLIGVSAIFAMLVKIAPYRLQRFLTFLDPAKDCLGAGYQICQSLLGIGSGGWFGLGFGQSKQKYLYLPEAYTDSIFAIMTEELGFLRMLPVLMLYGILGWRGYKVAQHAPDMFGRLVAVGITTWLVFQSIINIGAAVSILPLTGVTLPFISYGGTSMLVTLAAVGVLLNVSKHTKFDSVK
jgi:cell division protein FtsW